MPLQRSWSEDPDHGHKVEKRRDFLPDRPRHLPKKPIVVSLLYASESNRELRGICQEGNEGDCERQRQIRLLQTVQQTLRQRCGSPAGMYRCVLTTALMRSSTGWTYTILARLCP